MSVIQLFVTQPLLVRWTGKVADLSDFQSIVGNFTMFLIFLVIIWVIAAFGEELVYRGYMMNRVADFISNKRIAWTLSLIVISAVFGFSHQDQGVKGMIDEGLMGLLLGLIYLACDRSLAVPIIAHGIADTIDLILIYLGKYPGIQ